MPKGKAAHQPVTPERRRQFLEALPLTGSIVEAARVVTPRGTGPQAGYSTFRRLRERGPRPSPRRWTTPSPRRRRSLRRCSWTGS